MHYLTEEIWFPDVNQATEEGLLAIGGDLSVERLVLAYRLGVFPWFEENSPILWWSPNPRFVLFPEKLKVSKSLKQTIRNKGFEVTINEAFGEVVAQCSKVKRKGQDGTWITQNMQKAYQDLHELGYAKSVEVWLDGDLVGGLYGVDLNNGVFCGESMFAKVSDASKVGFVAFVKNSSYKLIDCQVYTSHLASLGAQEVPRNQFVQYLKTN